MGEGMMDFSSIYEEYDFSGIESSFNGLFPEWNLSFKELVLDIMQGEGLDAIFEQGKNIVSLLGAEVDAIRFVCVTLLLIGIISTVFTNFANIFPNQQIGNFGFQFTYLIMIIFLVNKLTTSYMF